MTNTPRLVSYIPVDHGDTHAYGVDDLGRVWKLANDWHARPPTRGWYRVDVPLLPGEEPLPGEKEYIRTSTWGPVKW